MHLCKDLIWRFIIPLAYVAGSSDSVLALTSLDVTLLTFNYQVNVDYRDVAISPELFLSFFNSPLVCLNTD